MAKIDYEYNKILANIIVKGFRYQDPNRQGVERIQIPSYEFKWDFKDGFPAITTKKLWWKGVVGELLFFLNGDMDIRILWENGIHIWDKDWMNFRGRKVFGDLETAALVKDTHPYPLDYSLGRVYGEQWRGFRGKDGNDVDQFAKLIQTLKHNPMSTSNIVTAWNPTEKRNMALPPCHWSFEVLSKPLPNMMKKLMLSNVKSPDDIDKIPTHSFYLKWHQRSVDTFLGLPFNIASYALLAQIIGRMTNMLPLGIIGDLSNVHIYEPHMEAVLTQLDRDVNKYPKCELKISDIAKLKFKKMNGFKNGLTSVDFGYYNDPDGVLSAIIAEDFELDGYQSYPPIKAEMLAYDKK